MPSKITCDNCGQEWPEDLDLDFCGKCTAPLGDDEESSTPDSGEKQEKPSTDFVKKPRQEKKDPSHAEEVGQEKRVSPGGELRYATVLFADIKGFTSFSEDRDADEVADTVGTLLEQLGSTIEEEGGLVDKYIGDAVMATFGLEHADPYAARTAVSTAFRMQEVVQSYAEEVGHEFSLRVGIHAGEVMWKSIGGGFTVMGDTVNTASRIEGKAPPGGVMVSEPVARILRGRWDVDKQDTVSLKGKEQPVSLYVVDKTRSGKQTSVITRPPFAGREQEVEQLVNEFQSAVQNQEMRFVFVEGDTGVGKTRLVRKLKEQVIKQNGIWSQTNFEGSGGGTEEGTAQLIRSIFEIRNVDDTQDILHQIRHKIESDFTWIPEKRHSVVTEYLAFLIGVEEDDFEIEGLEGGEKVKGAWIILRNLLERIGQDQPIVWCIENIQKGDARTARFLDWCQKAIWDGSITVVTTLREEEYGDNSDWYNLVERLREQDLEQETEEEKEQQKDPSKSTFIKLEELPVEDLSKALTASLSGGVDPEVTRRIARHCEGNPLFAVETIVDLYERDYLAPEGPDDQWTLTVPWSEVDFPGTLREVMEARLQKLPREGIEVAKRGAVIGRRFYLNAVKAIWDHKENQFQSGLGTLENTAMLETEPSPFNRIGETGIFQHGRFQEAAASRATQKERKDWMSSVAGWCGRIITSTSNPERAGQALFPVMARAYTTAEQRAKALTAYEKAGWLLLKNHRLEDAKDHFEKALLGLSESSYDESLAESLLHEMTTEETREGTHVSSRLHIRECALLMAQAAIDMDLGNLEDCQRKMDRVKPPLSEINDQEIVTLDHPYPILHMPKQLPGQLKNLDWWSQHQMELKSQLQLMESNVLEMQGELEETEQLLDDAYETLCDARDLLPEDRIYALYANWLYRKIYCIGDAQGNAEEALEILGQKTRDGDDIIDELDRLPTEERAEILHNKAIMLYRVGDYDRARKLERKLLRFWEQRERPEKAGPSLNLLGLINKMLADFDLAEKNYRKARRIFENLGKRIQEAQLHNNLGGVYLGKGNFEKAAESYTKSKEIFHEAGNTREEVGALGNLGLVFSDRGQYDKAEKCFKKQLNTSWEIGSQRLQIFAHGNLGYLYHKRGDLKSAINSYKEQLATSRDFGIRYGEAGALGSLADLYRERFTTKNTKTKSPEEDPARAFMCTEKAIDVAESTGNKMIRVHMLLNRAILNRWAAGGLMKDEHAKPKDIIKQGLANLKVAGELKDVPNKEIYAKSEESIDECITHCESLDVDHTLHSNALLEDARHQVLFGNNDKAETRFKQLEAFLNEVEEEGAEVSDIRQKIEALRNILS